MDNLQKLANRERIISLVNKYPVEFIFSLGLYHKFDNVKRIYLDELFDNKYKDIITYASEFIKINMGEQFYVCLVDYSDIEMNFFDQETIKSIKTMQIEIPKDNIYINKYIEAEECYGQYLIFEESDFNIKKYISGIINRKVQNEPYINIDIFFVNINADMVINLYDDRGLDVLSLSDKTGNILEI